MQPQQGPLQRVDETQDPFHKNNNYLSVFSHCCQLNDWIQFFPLHIDSHCVFPSLKLGCIFFYPLTLCSALCLALGDKTSVNVIEIETWNAHV